MKSEGLIVVVFVVVFFCGSYYYSYYFSDTPTPTSTTTASELVGHMRGNQTRAVLLSSDLSSKFKPTVVRKAAANTIANTNSKLEQGLARARMAIRKAAAGAGVTASIRNKSLVITTNNTVTHADAILYSPIYRNPTSFLQSYKEMEGRFKVYVYEEGDLPIVHDGPCKNIYSSEGRFLHEMEHGSNSFRTSNPSAAHVYFIPFSVTLMVKYLYNPADSYNLNPLQEFVSGYVKLISTKHPFWNRTLGADHFMLSCHDWGPHASHGNPFLYNTSIRVLCNANSSESFNPQKDVSLPEITLYGGDVDPKLISPPPPNISRPHLAFFAGGVHGSIRQTLLKHWENKDTDLLRVYQYLPKKEDYYESMLRSKFCLCPSGYEVASPRIVEAIYAECIPVILSEHYVLPFSDVLRWDAFSVEVDISEIPQLKDILLGVSEDKYMRLKEGLRAVRRHFVWNHPVKKFDVFHMILHSVWLRRLNLNLRVG